MELKYALIILVLLAGVICIVGLKNPATTADSQIVTPSLLPPCTVMTPTIQMVSVTVGPTPTVANV
jgi:hypothetical protein